MPTIQHHRLPLSVSGHETRVLGNRSCRFGRRGALNGVSSEIMQMYTHDLTGNSSRSVPSRTWVSHQWTCCKRQQSNEGTSTLNLTHIIVLWQCTECKGLAIGDTSSPNSKTTTSPPILSPLAENKDLVTWRLAVKPLKQCGNHASSVSQNQLSVKSTMIVLIDFYYVQLETMFICNYLPNFLCYALHDSTLTTLNGRQSKKSMSYNASTTRPNYSLGKPSNDSSKIQLTPGADRPSLFILRLPEIGGWL